MNARERYEQEERQKRIEANVSNGLDIKLPDGFLGVYAGRYMWLNGRWIDLYEPPKDKPKDADNG